MKFIINNTEVQTSLPESFVLLDYLRKHLNLPGTKEGCREGDCGACTVLIGEIINGELIYSSVNSCLFPIGNIDAKHVVTIEGINSKDLNQIQTSFVSVGASQCGFCTPGFIVSFTRYLLNNKVYSIESVVNALAGNICRCTGYNSIIRAVEHVLNILNEPDINKNDRISFLIKNNILPVYFDGIAKRLKNFESTKTNGHKKSAKYFVAGGTDLYVQKTDELPGSEITLLTNTNLSFIKLENDKCIVGAATSFETINDSPVFKKHFQHINNYFDLIASLPIRNSATVGGNIINASPIGDMTIFFLALNASVNFVGDKLKRTILLKDLYKGYKLLDISEDEYLESIEFNLPGDNSHFNFEKVSKRTHLDIASVNSAILIETNDSKIANTFLSAGGVAPVPLYLKKSSEFLIGKEISYETLNELLQITQEEISPISDVRGSKAYKRLLLNQLIKAHFVELFPELIKVEEVI